MVVHRGEADLDLRPDRFDPNVKNATADDRATEYRPVRFGLRPMGRLNPFAGCGLSCFMFGWLFGNSSVRTQAHDWVKDGALLLDVRTGPEFESGHIEGALNIPVQALAERMGELEKNRNIVVYCRSGMRSASAAKILKKAGFSEVLNLGGISNW